MDIQSQYCFIYVSFICILMKSLLLHYIQRKSYCCTHSGKLICCHLDFNPDSKSIKKNAYMPNICARQGWNHLYSWWPSLNCNTCWFIPILYDKSILSLYSENLTVAFRQMRSKIFNNWDLKKSAQMKRCDAMITKLKTRTFSRQGTWKKI